jgi:hypothetical protein
MGACFHGATGFTSSEMTDPPPTPSPERQPRGGRSGLIRDVLMLQVKLFVGGMHNLVLVPATLAAALLDFIVGPGPGGGLFYRVLAWGKWADEAIGLYAALDRRPPSPAPKTPPGAATEP